MPSKKKKNKGKGKKKKINNSKTDNKKTTNNNWKFVTSNRDRGKTYNTISKYGIVVFAHSTLGYEAMARGLRTVSLNHLFYNTQEKKDQVSQTWCEQALHTLQSRQRSATKSRPSCQMLDRHHQRRLNRHQWSRRL